MRTTSQKHFDGCRHLDYQNAVLWMLINAWFHVQIKGLPLLSHFRCFCIFACYSRVILASSFFFQAFWVNGMHSSSDGSSPVPSGWESGF